MKKFKPLLLLLVAFAVLSVSVSIQRADAFTIYNYSFNKFKKLVNIFAKNAGIKIKFTNIFHLYTLQNPDKNFTSCSVSTNVNDSNISISYHKKYDCTPYAYLNTYLKNVNLGYSFNMPKILTKADWRQILFNFLRLNGVALSKKGNTYYAFYWDGSGGAGTHNRLRKFNEMVIRHFKRGFTVYQNQSRYYNAKYRIVIIPYKYIVAFDNSNNSNNTESAIIKAHKTKAFNSIYPLALASLKNYKNKNLMPNGISSNTFSLSKAGLRRLIFNVVQPNYYENSVSALKQVSTLSNFDMSLGGQGATPAQIAAQVSNTENGMYRSVESSVSQLNSVTLSTKVLYNTVGNYYQNGLISRFGTIQTSLLKKVGIYSNIDISYPVILEKTNIFLSKINADSANIARFNKLFGGNFTKIKNRYNYVPNIPKFNMTMMMKIGSLLKGFGLSNNAIFSGNESYDLLQKWANYPIINLKSINFFSVAYFLLKGSLNNNSVDDKILRNIIMGHYKSARQEFYSIPAPEKVNTNYVAAFLSAKSYAAKKQITQDVYNKVYSILPMGYIKKGSVSWDMVAKREGSNKMKYAERLQKVYYLMKIIILHDKTKAKWTPWSGALQNNNNAQILKLWQAYKQN